MKVVIPRVAARRQNRGTTILVEPRAYFIVLKVGGDPTKLRLRETRGPTKRSKTKVRQEKRKRRQQEGDGEKEGE